MKGVYLKKGNTRVSVVPYYRIGDLFLTTIATNPSNYLGGKWELFGPGRCLVCVDTSQTEFNSVKKTGGSKYLQKHKHGLRVTLNMTQGAGNERALVVGGGNAWSINDTYQMTNVGDGTSGNLQPYITCYIWIRTA